MCPARHNKPTNTEKILYHLEHFGPGTAPQLTEAMGLTIATVRQALWVLEKQSIVVKKGGKPYHYALRSKG